jgi:cation-transporting ATPase 13A3/4/5
MYSNFIYIFTLLAFSISRPWRKEFFTNVPFTVLLVLVLALSTVLVIVP